jgi:hypothetical protein
MIVLPFLLGILQILDSGVEGLQGPSTPSEHDTETLQWSDEEPVSSMQADQDGPANGFSNVSLDPDDIWVTFDMLQQNFLPVIEQLQDLQLKSDSLQDQLSNSDQERLLFQSKMDLAIKDLLHTCQLNYTSFMDQRFMMWTQEQQHTFLTWQNGFSQTSNLGDFR